MLLSYTGNFPAFLNSSLNSLIAILRPLEPTYFLLSELTVSKTYDNISFQELIPNLIQILFTFNCLEFFHDSNEIEEKDILQIYEEIENALNYSVKLDPFKLTENIFQKTIEKTGIK